MPYLQTSQEWLQQSSLLLKAYPSSVRKFLLSRHNSKLTIKLQTRITTKYSVLPPDDGTKSKKRKRPAKDAEPSAQDTETSAQAPTARAELILRTFDPSSGVCLKYRTDKAAEVGRLVSSLGRLGRGMAALPDQAEGIKLLSFQKTRVG